MSEELARRKAISFAQAEGAAPLPRQLDRTELTRPLRARLCAIIVERLNRSASYQLLGEPDRIGEAWATLLYNYHLRELGRMPNTFDPMLSTWDRTLSQTFDKGTYISIFGLIQFLVREDGCPFDFAEEVDYILTDERCAFRLIDRDTLVPVASEEEVSALTTALSDLAAIGAGGARAHLKSGAEHLSAGQWADSIRESIHAVESTARLIHPSNGLGRALAELEKAGRIHGGLKNGFGAIYGYTSDEQGIRHPLIDEPVSEVDEADALFMIGACAAFVSYLIAKARKAGIAVQTCGF